MNTSLNEVTHHNQYVLITSNMYRPSIGGIENSLYHLGQEYKSLGYKVIIVASDINGLGLCLPEFEVEDGIDIYRYRACSGQGFLGFTKHIYHAYSLYKHILKKYNPAVVVCRYHFNLILLDMAGYKNISYLIPGVVKNETLASLPQNIKGIAKLRSKASFLFHTRLQSKAIKQAKSLFVFSQNMLDQVRELTSRQDILVTKPGVSLKRFFPLSQNEKLVAREKLGIATNKKVFLCIGRLVKAKGFETAIRAINLLNKDNAELWVLGEGPLNEEFKILINQLNCQAKVKLLGRQSSPETYYQAADFFVMSSVYEPLGQTILEGLASGLPIISAPSSGSIVTASNEIIDAEKNFFTFEHSVDAFCSAFLQASEFDDEKYQMVSQYNREQAEIRFSWSTLAKVLILDTPNEKNIEGH
ncbi:MAG: glycosyltransferase [Alteromonadaceae bacterium]|nr:glycosyltransferase [Alteromonadaceae bacterium]